jgi:hypothetical protein
MRATDRILDTREQRWDATEFLGHFSPQRNAPATTDELEAVASLFLQRC